MHELVEGKTRGLATTPRAIAEPPRSSIWWKPWNASSQDAETGRRRRLRANPRARRRSSPTVASAAAAADVGPTNAGRRCREADGINSSRAAEEGGRI